MRLVKAFSKFWFEFASDAIDILIRLFVSRHLIAYLVKFSENKTFSICDKEITFLTNVTKD